MKYILDFDRTLFDTQAYVATVKQAGLTLEQRITPDIWDQYQVRDFLYPEVLDWLRSKNKADLHILTAISPELGPLATEFQKQKLHSGNFFEFVSDITFMTGDKGSYVKEIAGDAEAVFLDDKISHHISVHDHAPAVHCVLIRRPGESSVEAATADFVTVSNLNELDQYIETIGGNTR